MKENQVDHFGIVISEKPSFGFIKYLDSQETIYFKHRSCQTHVKLNDRVVFQIIDGKKGDEATAIRHVFTNMRGINFVPCVNKHHIHLDLELFLPLITQEIGDYLNEEIELEKKLDGIVGKTICLETTSIDRITYAIRKGKFGHSRLVHDREPIECSSVFCALQKSDNYYIIKTVYIGNKARLEPWDEKATEEDLDFWMNHALVYNSVEIIEGSETDNCPWMIIGMPSVSRLKVNYH